ncbi:MAG: ATP-dependent helicase [Nocardioidaceae bacterium]
MAPVTPSYVFKPARSASAPPVLDDAQRAVVDHRGGPLLVLAGPGTGKTTTLVEAVVDRIEHRGLRPDQALVLTFGRKAADELRARITARLGRTTAMPMAVTFHSFCYALVRRFADPEAFVGPPQLLSAPEQDLRIRDLLAGGRREDGVTWPASLRPALHTHGFARELAAAFSRVRELQLDPGALVTLGGDDGPWDSVGRFFEEYLDVADAQHLVDYAELVYRAGLLLSDPAVVGTLRAEYPFVVVDEYQDTDRAQVSVLQALAGQGRDLVAVGDPDQAIYAFRGADVRGLLAFRDQFRTVEGAPAPMLALASTRRFGDSILAASRSVVRHLAIPGQLDAQQFTRFRNPAAVDPPYGDGVVEVRRFVSAAAEAEQIAGLLRTEHLRRDVPWSDMAVVVRSGTRSIPRLRRTLGAAGVPVAVAGDEVPLAAEPAVRTLLMLLRVVDRLHQRTDGAPVIRPDEVEALLTSPVAGMDPSGVRRVAKQLRRLDGDDLEGALPRPSLVLLAEALEHPKELTGVDGPDADRLRAFGRLLVAAAESLSQGRSVETVLWDLWSGSRWPQRLQTAAESGGAGRRVADRDLDAVCALFDLAARAEERQQRRRLASFVDEVEGQQIPAQTFAEQGVSGDAVRLLTAHRSKGLEWRVVVVAGVQEQLWPDVRHRGSLLGSDRLDAQGVPPVAVLREPSSRTSLLADERRLFYVACTRARERLVVTAVESPTEGGDQPSRFLSDLGVDAGPVEGRPERPMSLRGVLGQLRREAETTDDPARLTALAGRIARLAGASRGALLPQAVPEHWWGVHDETQASTPVRPPDQPINLSGSGVDGLVRCPLRWFLAREAAGETQSTSAQGFGSIVHALAEAVVTGELPPDESALVAQLGRVWGQLQFEVPWASAAERTQAERAIARFVAWHTAERGRRVLAAEHAFEVTFDAAGDTVRLRGSMDRVEIDADGRVVVVDFKTGKNPPTGRDLPEHPQLGVYQLAVEQGAADGLVDGEPVPGGAELVHLRKSVKGRVKVQHQSALEPDEGVAVRRQVAHAVRAIRDESFPATVGGHCTYCQFRALCPAQPEGAGLLSAPVQVPGEEPDL